MDWQRRYGDQYETLLALHEQNKDVVPDWRTPKAIIDRPDVDVIDIPYLKAYHLLTGSRQSGMSVGAIPLSEIRAYLEIYGAPSFFDCESDDIDAFVQIITRVDNHFLTEYHKEQEAKSKKPSPKRK